MEQNQCLNELLHAVYSVALCHVNGIQQGNDDFKSPKPCIVGGILNDRDSKNLVFTVNYIP